MLLTQLQKLQVIIGLNDYFTHEHFVGLSGDVNRWQQGNINFSWKH